MVNEMGIFKKKTDKHICCICGNEFDGWGNNPWPVAPKYDKKNKDPRCCDDCNYKFVIMERLRNIKG